VRDGTLYADVSGSVSNAIFKQFTAVLKGEAPFRIRRTQRIMMKSGYQLRKIFLLMSWDFMVCCEIGVKLEIWQFGKLLVL
jgi:hypothetical protein